jgi:hypothetical protein
MLADFLHFVEVILVFIFALIVLFVALLIVVSVMPKSNPLKMILAALAHRVGATAGLMMLDPIATTVPVIGEVWDLATIVWLIYFWYTFFKQLPGSNPAKNITPLRPRAKAGSPPQFETLATPISLAGARRLTRPRSLRPN